MRVRVSLTAPSFEVGTSNADSFKYPRRNVVSNYGVMFRDHFILVKRSWYMGCAVAFQAIETSSSLVGRSKNLGNCDVT